MTRPAKPRTASQRTPFNRGQPRYQPVDHAPLASWWTQPRSRSEFTAAIAREQARMKQSTIGTSNRIVFAKDSEAG